MVVGASSSAVLLDFAEQRVLRPSISASFGRWQVLIQTALLG